MASSKTRVKRVSNKRRIRSERKKHIADSFTAGGKKAIETMKQNVPVDLGDLESTIEMTDDRNGHVILSAGGPSNISDKEVDYARDVEYGTVHNTPNGTYSIPAQPFFRLGIDDGWQEVKRNLKSGKR